MPPLVLPDDISLTTPSLTNHRWNTLAPEFTPAAPLEPPPPKRAKQVTFESEPPSPSWQLWLEEAFALLPDPP
eukprot:12915882-Prorocentrum_lima.AAC.1